MAGAPRGFDTVAAKKNNNNNNNNNNDKVGSITIEVINATRIDIRAMLPIQVVKMIDAIVAACTIASSNPSTYRRQVLIFFFLFYVIDIYIYIFLPSFSSPFSSPPPPSSSSSSSSSSSLLRSLVGSQTSGQIAICELPPEGRGGRGGEDGGGGWENLIFLESERI